jgi:hypothetical protein
MVTSLMRRWSCAAAFAAALVALAQPGTARAQYFMSYAGDAAACRIRDTITVVTQAEQALDNNHRTIGRWLLSLAGSMLADGRNALPDAAFQARLSDVRVSLEKKNNKKAARAVKRAKEELRKFASVWNVGDAEAKMGELCALVEKGESQAALADARSLADLVRIDPVQRCLDRAGDRLNLAREKNAKGYEMDAVKALGEAKYSLRRAYLGARLAQSKIILAHARLMLRDGKRWRAQWALWRGARKIRKGSYLAAEAEADALTKIAAEIEQARALASGKPAEAANKLAEVEAKISALLKMLQPAPSSAA